MRIQESAISPPRDRISLIEVTELTKKFDGITAVDRISFAVIHGELFGFLGPNGAGKTTTINILTGLARPDSGTIKISGLECTRKPKASQHLMGIVPDESNLYPELSGFDNLCFCASLYGMPKAERRTRARELLETFGLKEASDRKFSAYSKGMKRKLTIAAGIIHRPQILFLDEPTTGIDVASARQIRQLITKLHRAGTTIFFTTHYIEEAERLLLAPIPLELLMLAKTSGAVLFGVANAFVPVIIALFLTDLSQVVWVAVFSAVVMIAIASTFLGLFVAVSVSEIFEADIL